MTIRQRSPRRSSVTSMMIGVGLLVLATRIMGKCRGRSMWSKPMNTSGARGYLRLGGVQFVEHDALPGSVSVLTATRP